METHERAYNDLLAESERVNLPRSYKTDLTKIDREALQSDPSISEYGFVFVLRENGTALYYNAQHVYPLEYEVKEHPESLYYVWTKEEGLKQTDGKAISDTLKRISWARAFEFYKVFNGMYAEVPNDYLERQGIEFLTGEACGLSMRILCDLTEEGKELISEFFGGCVPQAHGWNNDIASVMLPRSVLTDLTVFALIRNGAAVVVQSDEDELFTCDDMKVASALIDRLTVVTDWKVGYRTYEGSKAPGNGLRNQHMMSGRIQ